jgi:hypothetical protein
MKIFKIIVLLIFSFFLESCIKYKNENIPNQSTKQKKIKHSLLIADFLKSYLNNIDYCLILDFSVERKFSIRSIIKTDFLDYEDSVITLNSCEHWEKQPFLESKIDGLPIDTKFQWLLLYTKKDFGNYLIEYSPIFTLKDGTNAYCDTGDLIGKILSEKISYLGEYVGKPIKIKSDYENYFYNNSPCYNVRNGYSFLENGIILKKTKQVR